MITVDDEILRDNDKELGNNLIAILNVAFSLSDISSTMSILNDTNKWPAVIVTLKTATDVM